MTQQNGEEYMTFEEAAAQLGVSRRTVERYVKSRQLTRYRKGFKQVLLKRSEIEDLKMIRPFDESEHEE